MGDGVERVFIIPGEDLKEAKTCILILYVYIICTYKQTSKHTNKQVNKHTNKYLIV